MQKNYLILFLLLVTLSCRKASAPPPPQINSFLKQVITPDDRKTITAEEAKTYHVNDTYQYKYRTGDPGQYEYNYDVKGINIDGDSVFGNINVQEKYGAGILLGDTIPDIEINTEWVSYGKLVATDLKGNKYQLIVK
ncbi:MULTISPECIES: hypothetical protein [unclassified Flavobacterium]|uniref:hypothetical protein n=1 Tax=unclassified Flavobacterium TaxID=196869 RepID=UPI0012A87E36|nr:MULTISPECIES: hypothetical protein [unclassified Flavobacterium]MBF4487330.1 hypothetical protein [Flavobacterium sp. CSZ]QGK72720.1 hypothetical protein GIY83_01140 [Flavobacterium sp. SLB02]